MRVKRHGIVLLVFVGISSFTLSQQNRFLLRRRMQQRFIP